MATQNRATIVGVFEDHQQAQRAVSELRRLGFREDQIGVARRGSDEGRTVASSDDDAEGETYAGEGAATGLAAGAGVGALWGLGILAGVLPAIGPAIAGGTLAAILSSAAAGATAAGLGGALVGLGLSKDEVDYYNTEFEAGRTVVTVSAAGRESEAESVLSQFGSYDIARRGESTASAAKGVNNTDYQSQQSCSTEPRHAADNRMTAFEEELAIDKRQVEKGSVNVHKEVHTEHKTIDVPVTREEVVIERMPSSGTTSGSTNDRQEIRIPVREEEIRVEKQTVAKEDVVIGKRTVHDTERVDATVRKEEIKVDSDADVTIRDERRRNQ